LEGGCKRAKDWEYEEGKGKKKTNEEQQNTIWRHKKWKQNVYNNPSFAIVFTNSLPVFQCRFHFHAQSKEMKRRKKKDSTMKQIQNMGTISAK